MNERNTEMNVAIIDQNNHLIEIEEVELQGSVYQNCCRIVQFD